MNHEYAYKGRQTKCGARQDLARPQSAGSFLPEIDFRRIATSNSNFKPHTVLRAEEKAAASANGVSLPPGSDTRLACCIQDRAEIRIRFKLCYFDRSTDAVLDDKPGRFFGNEKRRRRRALADHSQCQRFPTRPQQARDANAE